MKNTHQSLSTELTSCWRETDMKQLNEISHVSNGENFMQTRAAGKGDEEARSLGWGMQLEIGETGKTPWER